MGIQQAIRLRSKAGNPSLAFAVLAASCAGAAFWVPGVRACHGDFPVPLDDVFIHFDFARSLCRGHPFTWVAGQGFSSGETSPLYAAVMAVGWAAGFRDRLAWFAGLVAWASIVWAMTSLGRLVRSGAVACAGAAMLVAIGALDFTLLSGMEVALFVALLFRAFVLAERLMHAPPHLRAPAQARLGRWGVLLVLTRPEAAVIVAVLAVLAARHARTSSPLAALARVAAPGACATLLLALLDWRMTGDWLAAGARLKLLSSNPYLGDVERAREAALNAFYFVFRVVLGSMVARPKHLWVLAACAAVGVATRATRELAVSVLCCAVLWTVLVSLNGAARYQGFRYYAPAVALLVLAVTLGLDALGRRVGAPVAALVGGALALGAASRASAQARFFRDASQNVHDQQVRVGRDLRDLDVPGAVLLNDAGAIAYFADRPAVDALGLGGFRGLPFTRAALSGEASTLELLQRLPPGERPTLLALYPNWFPGITGRFARPIERVTIEHNVICGGPTKLVALADWAPLDADAVVTGAIDELDVADVESERVHGYVSPAPRGGWAVLDVRGGVFDGGRIIPEGEEESFTVLASGPAVKIVVRSDGDIDAEVLVNRDAVPLRSARSAGWSSATSAAVHVERGDRVVIHARRPLRDFHVWIVSGR